MGRKDGVPERGSKPSPHSGETLFTLPVSRSDENRGEKRREPICDGRFERCAMGRTNTEKILAISTSPLGVLILLANACIVWNEFLNSLFQVQQFSPRRCLPVSNQGFRQTHRS